MIETVTDVDRFYSENLEGDWIVHIVPVEDNVHSADNIPSILFIHNILIDKTYYYACNHPDSTPKPEIRPFLQEVWHRRTIKKIWAIDKKAFEQFKLSDVNDANLCGFLCYNDILDVSDYETEAHALIRRNSNGLGKINIVIPLMKHKEAFDEMCGDIKQMIRKFKIDNSYSEFNKIIHTLGEIEANGIYVDAALFEKHFEVKPNKRGMVYSKYNTYTSTGRPANSYGGINYAALKHNDGSRSCFVSRYGNDGRIVVIDYTAFHPRIVCNLIKYNIPIETDIYQYLAKLYFQKKEIDEIDIKNAKQLTFRQFYGGIDEKYSHIKYLANLKLYVNEQWGLFQSRGYIETPIFKRKITNKHIKDPNPEKVFNYILQATEGEIAIPQVQLVLDYLKEKQTKVIMYIYDSILLDFHKNDGFDTLNKIRQLMSCNSMFPMKTYIGNSYDDVKLLSA